MKCCVVIRLEARERANIWTDAKSLKETGSRLGKGVSELRAKSSHLIVWLHFLDQSECWWCSSSQLIKHWSSAWPFMVNMECYQTRIRVRNERWKTFHFHGTKKGILCCFIHRRRHWRLMPPHFIPSSCSGTSFGLSYTSWTNWSVWLWPAASRGNEEGAFSSFVRS